MSKTSTNKNNLNFNATLAKKLSSGATLGKVTRTKEGLKINNYRDVCLILQLNGVRMAKIDQAMKGKAGVQGSLSKN